MPSLSCKQQCGKRYRVAGRLLHTLPSPLMVNRTLVAFAVRVVIALATCTFFQPDEYFQSLEVAHHAVFGYGHLTWEWLAPRPIRSVLYPALTIPVYWLLKTLELDQSAALVRIRARVAATAMAKHMLPPAGVGAEAAARLRGRHGRYRADPAREDPRRGAIRRHRGAYRAPLAFRARRR